MIIKRVSSFQITHILLLTSGFSRRTFHFPIANKLLSLYCKILDKRILLWTHHIAIPTLVVSITSFSVLQVDHWSLLVGPTVLYDFIFTYWCYHWSLFYVKANAYVPGESSNKSGTYLLLERLVSFFTFCSFLGLW